MNCKNVFIKLIFNTFLNNFSLDITLLMDCSITTPIIGELLDCPLTIIQTGDPKYTYVARMDYGDGFVQNITLADTDPSTFIAPFSHRYQSNGTYSVYLTIDMLGKNWTLKKDMIIYGKEIIFSCHFLVNI